MSLKGEARLRISVLQVSLSVIHCVHLSRSFVLPQTSTGRLPLPRANLPLIKLFYARAEILRFLLALSYQLASFVPSFVI